MKKVLIVGATSAIAMACARRWAAEGAMLFLVARDSSKLDAVARDLEVRSGSAVHTCQLDATDAARHEEMIEAANDSIDTLVNDSQDASTEGIDNGGWNHDD